MSVAASVWPAILFLSLNVLGQNPNPVPFINQPVVPAAVAPNGTAFTLTINGTNFSSGSVVNWNGNARSTTFISASQLTAAISASDIAAASTAVLTVTNPGPGGGTSNTIFFPIHNSTTSISLTRSDLSTSSAPVSVVVADFQGKGKLSLATVNNGANTISVLLGNGDGTFAPAVNYPTGNLPTAIIAADFNHDGILDLAVTNSGDGTVSLLLGLGDGTFAPKTDFVVSSSPAALAAGDLNGDGNLDLVVANSGSATISVLLGQGDGTFALQATYLTGNAPQSVAVGDFNGDG